MSFLIDPPWLYANGRAYAALAPAAVIARVRDDATAAMTLAGGFLGDPLRPLTGKVFGPLVTAAQY